MSYRKHHFKYEVISLSLLLKEIKALPLTHIKGRAIASLLGREGAVYYPKLDAAIAAYQRANGLTQADMAVRVGMSENTFSWKRRGVKEFSLSEAVCLCDLIGESLDSVKEGAVAERSMA